MTTLGFERGVSSSMSHQRFEKELAGIIDTARERGATANPLIRDRLVQQWIKVQLIKQGNQRLLFDALNGTQQADALRATTKLWWSRTHQDTLDLALDILGPDGQVLTGDPAGDGQWIPGVGLRRGQRTTRRPPCSRRPCLPVGHDRRRHIGDPARDHRGADPQAAPGPLELNSGLSVRVVTITDMKLRLLRIGDHPCAAWPWRRWHSRCR